MTRLRYTIQIVVSAECYGKLGEVQKYFIINERLPNNDIKIEFQTRRRASEDAIKLSNQASRVLYELLSALRAEAQAPSFTGDIILKVYSSDLSTYIKLENNLLKLASGIGLGVEIMFYASSDSAVEDW